MRTKAYTDLQIRKAKALQGRQKPMSGGEFYLIVEPISKAANSK